MRRRRPGGLLRGGGQRPFGGSTGQAAQEGLQRNQAAQRTDAEWGGSFASIGHRKDPRFALQNPWITPGDFRPLTAPFCCSMSPATGLFAERVPSLRRREPFVTIVATDGFHRDR